MIPPIERGTTIISDSREQENTENPSREDTGNLNVPYNNIPMANPISGSQRPAPMGLPIIEDKHLIAKPGKNNSGLDYPTNGMNNKEI